MNWIWFNRSAMPFLLFTACWYSWGHNWEGAATCCFLALCNAWAWWARADEKTRPVSDVAFPVEQ